MPESTIIVPVYNQSRLTAQCLDTLLEQGHRRIVVVDDGSTDDTPRMLAAYGGAIQVITHGGNLGFGASCNDGVSVADGEYVILLNNDTVPGAGWRETLERYADGHPAAAVVGSRLVYPDHTIQHAGVVICQDRYPRHIYSGFPAGHPAVNRSRRFQIVTAACMLVRREAYLNAGGFDPAFHNGFEDVDLCLRLGESGHEIHYCAESVVVHLESVSPGRFKRDRDNVAAYRERWWERVQPDDVRCYLDDGLLRLSYEGRYPVGLEVSPLLATLDGDTRTADLERSCLERSRQVADLLHENTRLRLELGARAGDSPELEYHRMRTRIHEIVQQTVPAGSIVLVVSKGDGSLLRLNGCRGWHFPQTERGVYAGHHPANSEEAISHLESLRARGAEFIMIPATSRWWLDHYPEFGRHLNGHYRRLSIPADVAFMYSLRESPGGGRPQLPAHESAKMR
jgi:GT2 family glycosyltransferase